MNNQLLSDMLEFTQYIAACASTSTYESEIIAEIRTLQPRIKSAIADATQEQASIATLRSAVQAESAKMCEIIAALGLDIAVVEQGHVIGAIKKLQASQQEQAKPTDLQAVPNEEAGGVTDEPTMLWDAEDAENCYGDGPEDFANNYASNCMMRGEDHEVEVLCAYRGSNRTMRVVMPQIDDEDGRVTWSWSDTPAASTIAPAIDPAAAPTPPAARGLTDADIEDEPTIPCALGYRLCRCQSESGCASESCAYFDSAIAAHLAGNTTAKGE